MNASSVIGWRRIFIDRRSAGSSASRIHAEARHAPIPVVEYRDGMSDEIQHPLPADPVGYTPALEKTPDLRAISFLPAKLKVDDATKQAARWIFNDAKHVPLALICGMDEVDITDTREES